MVPTSIQPLKLAWRASVSLANSWNERSVRRCLNERFALSPRLVTSFWLSFLRFSVMKLRLTSLACCAVALTLIACQGDKDTVKVAHNPINLRRSLITWIKPLSFWVCFLFFFLRRMGYNYCDSNSKMLDALVYETLMSIEYVLSLCKIIEEKNQNIQIFEDALKHFCTVHLSACEWNRQACMMTNIAILHLNSTMLTWNYTNGPQYSNYVEQRLASLPFLSFIWCILFLCLSLILLVPFGSLSWTLLQTNLCLLAVLLDHTHTITWYLFFSAVCSGSGLAERKVNIWVFC